MFSDRDVYQASSNIWGRMPSLPASTSVLQTLHVCYTIMQYWRQICGVSLACLATHVHVAEISFEELVNS